MLAVVAGFILLFVSDYVIHQILLMGLYEQTANLWRSPETMMDFFPLMLGSQFLMSAITAMIFTRNYEAKGIIEGARFGLLLGLLFALMMSMSYIWMPIPLALASSWGAAGFLQGLGLGIAFALTYRK